MSWLGFIRIDPEIVKKADVSVPIILATMTIAGRKGVFPIDGWHRIARAIQDGLDELPAYVLNKRESDRIVESRGLI